MLKKPKFVTRNIFLLGLISFATDMASEMLYPVMPLFLQHAGYSLLAIGFLEGIAEAISGLNKVFVGYISDRLNKRNLFVRLGYGISALAKPAIGLFPSFWFVFGMRLLDRIGKGIRTAPRDAILISESKEQDRGRVFGFHRSFDTFGAMVGPFMAFAFLYLNPNQYSGLFIFALFPGILAIFFTLLLSKEKKAAKLPKKSKPTLKTFLNFWYKSSIFYKRLLIGFFLLAILNSSNVFLLLRAREMGSSDLFILGSYIFYNLIFALSSFPMGYLSDRINFKYTYIFGLLIFSLVYSLFAFDLSPLWLFLVFGLYGIFSAADEGVSKAWLSLHIPSDYKATGIGLNLTLNSLAFLAASVLTALLWENYGAKLTFTLISLGGFILIFYFLFFSPLTITAVKKVSQ